MATRTDINTTTNKKKKDNNDKNNKKLKTRRYLDTNRIFKWFSDNSEMKHIIKGRGNQDYIIKAIPIYDE